MSANDFPPFIARPPWLGGDLQTVRNLLRPPPPLAGRRLRLALDDGSGDVLWAAIDHPAVPRGGPLLVLIHGLAGCEESAYVVNSARHFLSLGWRVLRLNLRGAGPSRADCSGFYHAGRSEDLRRALAVLIEESDDGIVLYAYSLGANMMLKFLGEGGAEGVRAAISVSAPIDLAATWKRFSRPRNLVYQRWLLGHMKREAAAPGADLSERERRAVAAARTVWEFDDSFVAPRHGFAGADDYYARCSAAPFLAAIAVPTLLIHAGDDPWIPAAPYECHDWRSSPALTPVLTRSGGHVGFHGAGSPVPWHDRCAERFLDAILAS